MLEARIRAGLEFAGRKLQLVEKPRYGRQFPIPGIGFIDLLAIDLTTNELVVIELKKDGHSDREVLGQTQTYMGWVQTNMAQPNQRVVGLICVGQSSEKLRLAVAATQNVTLLEYGMSFRVS